MTVEDYRDWLKDEEEMDTRRKQLVVLFILTILGLLAPLTGSVAGIQAYRSRTLLVGETGTYLALGYGAAVIGVVYAVVFVLLYVGF